MRDVLHLKKEELAKHSLPLTYLNYWGYLENGRVIIVNKSLRGLLEDCDCVLAGVGNA